MSPVSTFQSFWPYLAQSQARVRCCSVTGEMAISYENDTTRQKAPNQESGLFLSVFVRPTTARQMTEWI